MASSFVGSGASRNAELSPFGQKQAVKKVIDYKIDNGRRFYKVKWECSWEAEENLLEYQNLVDQFWGFVNRVKSEDGRAGLKQVHSEDSGNVSCQNQDSSKAANRKLITFVTAAPAKIGDSTLKAILPSNLKPAQGSDLSKTQGKELPQAVIEADGTRKYPCNVCHLSFKRRDMLVRHSRTHSKEFCYFCAICGKGFIRRYVLVRHLIKEHNTTDDAQIKSTKRLRKPIARIKGAPELGLVEQTVETNESHEDDGKQEEEEEEEEEEREIQTDITEQSSRVEESESETPEPDDNYTEPDQCNDEPQLVPIQVQKKPDSDDVEMVILDKEGQVSHILQLESLLHQAVSEAKMADKDEETEELSSYHTESIAVKNEYPSERETSDSSCQVDITQRAATVYLVHKTDEAMEFEGNEEDNNDNIQTNQTIQFQEAADEQLPSE